MSSLTSTASLKSPPLSITPGNLATAAQAAAAVSYSPYTKSQSGVAVRSSESEDFAVGWVLENAAFDQTIDPLQVALIDLIGRGVQKLSTIVDVVLAERRGNPTQYKGRTKDVLSAIAPEAAFTYIQFD